MHSILMYIRSKLEDAASKTNTTMERRELIQTNHFELVDGKFLVLVNHEGQYSLWPGFVAVPNGWTQAFGLSTREECVDFINEKRVVLRPRSLYADTGPT